MPITISGLDLIPSMNFKKNDLLYKTILIQEMLKKGFLTSNAVYVSYVHTDKILLNTTKL